MSFEVTRIAPPTPELVGYRKGAPDVDEAVGVSLEVLRWLLPADKFDLSKTKEGLEKDYESVAALGRAGRLYPELAQGVVSHDDLIRIVDGKKPTNVPKTHRDPQLWIPGRDASGYTESELNAGPALSEGRIALFTDEDTGVDPMLHGVGLAFDGMYREPGKLTQLKLVGERTREFCALYPNRAFGALALRNIAVMNLMDRARGVDPQSAEFVLNRGYMRDALLGRRKVAGGSVVGDVNSHGSQLWLHGAYGSGSANPNFGVGLVAGPEPSKEA